MDPPRPDNWKPSKSQSCTKNHKTWLPPFRCYSHHQGEERAFSLKTFIIAFRSVIAISRSIERREDEPGISLKNWTKDTEEVWGGHLFLGRDRFIEFWIHRIKVQSHGGIHENLESFWKKKKRQKGKGSGRRRRKKILLSIILGFASDN